MRSTLSCSIIGNMLAKFASIVVKSASWILCLRSMMRIAVSLAEPMVLVAMRLPLMSSMVLIGPPFFTM